MNHSRNGEGDMPEVEQGPTRVRGEVVSWNSGWGFVKRLSDGAEFFCHFSAIRGDGYRNLEEGWIVEFEVGPRPNRTDDTRLQANNVVVIERNGDPDAA